MDDRDYKIMSMMAEGMKPILDRLEEIDNRVADIPRRLQAYYRARGYYEVKVDAIGNPTVLRQSGGASRLVRFCRLPISPESSHREIVAMHELGRERWR